jgi:hypothetical protein
MRHPLAEFESHCSVARRIGKGPLIRRRHLACCLEPGQSTLVGRSCGRDLAVLMRGDLLGWQVMMIGIEEPARLRSHSAELLFPLPPDHSTFVLSEVRAEGGVPVLLLQWLVVKRFRQPMGDVAEGRNVLHRACPSQPRILLPLVSAPSVFWRAELRRSRVQHRRPLRWHRRLPDQPRCGDGI